MHSWKPKLVKPTPDPASPAETASPAAGEVNGATTPTTQLSGWRDRRLSYETLLFLTAGVACLTYITFRPFMKVLFVAIIMAIVFSPLHKRLSRIFRNANIAALVTTVLAILECCMATGIGTGSTHAAAWFCARRHRLPLARRLEKNAWEASVSTSCIRRAERQLLDANGNREGRIGSVSPC